MERHVLVTISDEASWWGLRFMGGFFGHKEKLKITLMYVAPALFDYDKGVTADAATDILLSQKQQAKAQALLRSAREWALAQGFAPSDVLTKVVARQYGVLKDIITEAHRGLYDAVVVGRRYLTWIEQVMDSSVSRGLLWENIDFPVWVCPLVRPEHKHVLLCVDGSAESLRMADHVGFMLADAPEHTITLLHVTEPQAATEAETLCTPQELNAVAELKEQSIQEAERSGEASSVYDLSEDDSARAVEHVPCSRIMKIFAEAQIALEENGIAKTRIKTLSLEAKNKAKAIVRLAEESGYAAIAVGRRERSRSFVWALTALTVSERLHDDVHHCALWISK